MYPGCASVGYSRAMAPNARSAAHDTLLSLTNNDKESTKCNRLVSRHDTTFKMSLQDNI